MMMLEQQLPLLKLLKSVKKENALKELQGYQVYQSAIAVCVAATIKFLRGCISGNGKEYLYFQSAQKPICNHCGYAPNTGKQTLSIKMHLRRKKIT